LINKPSRVEKNLIKANTNINPAEVKNKPSRIFINLTESEMRFFIYEMRQILIIRKKS